MEMKFKKMNNKKNIKESKDDFNERWEETFGDTDRVIVMSVEETMKQLREMENFD